MAKTFSLLLVLAVAASSALGYSNNCHGSSRCTKDMAPTCVSAYSRFTDGTIYTASTSRTYGNCAAIYRCNGLYPSGMTGSKLKNLFSQIYSAQGCKGCGSHAFNGGDCEVTLNYCSDCKDSGTPH
ncbi:hypothetical protein BGZ70_008184 [Mortierella alpina]|uniref:Uncharacterized protein n=1 Tax=Mortierella alpina TaxID=64518 RepID=A0A9P6JDZ8_MORAP|nr:hypothetical protein BGZ70_008184 [Mortierella alpina]